MKKILVLNGGGLFAGTGGKLNDALTAKALEVLTGLGLETKTTKIQDGYDVEKEVEKILWADALIWQFPAWWMGEPWFVKQYIDEVFCAGGKQFLTSDGRHRTDPAHNYGTGGLLLEKHYMISTTWNAPFEAFTEDGEFFESFGIDGVMLHFHKLNQFIGMKPLPTFVLNDVVKNPEFDSFMESWEEHLKGVFAP